jgi:group I intron endonuclease
MPPRNIDVTTHLYRITNLVNGKDYVGISTDYNKRWKEHICYAKREEAQPNECVVSKAIRKYGLDNFKFEIIGVANTWTIAQEHERMVRYFGMGNYNRTMGGDGILGWTHSEETRRKISEKAKADGRRPPAGPEVTAKIVASSKITNARPEVRQRRSIAATKAQSSPEYRQRMSETCLKVGATPENKEAKRKGQLSRWEKGGEQARKERGEQVRERSKDPEVRKAISEGTKLGCSTPEAKANRSKATNERWEKAKALGFKSFAELSEYERNNNPK